ncbi:MAG: glycoside hydrolase family 88 protein [Treponema sp.]|nr:glycoside hydrolase family 88 protein [Treponema sp.]
MERSVIEEKLKLVANRMMAIRSHGIKEVFPISLIDINCWEWPQGVGIFGLYKYYTISKRQEILDFLLSWYDARISEGILEKNVNTTSPMLTLTYLYEITGKESYLLLIKEWADWIMEEKGLIRTGNGCFQHMITGNANDGEILIDTVFMTLLFLARAGKILARPDYLNEVNYQFLSHIQYLFDAKAGLFYHGFNFNLNHNYGKVHWGRGNCWYTVAILEYLDEFEIDPALRRYFTSVYLAQIASLKTHVDGEKKLWRTVIDDASSYIEISGSAGFLCGMMKGVKQGILSEKAHGNIIAGALENIVAYIADDGAVENVSYGTPVGNDKEFYMNIPIRPMTYGQALMILCLAQAIS